MKKILLIAFLSALSLATKAGGTHPVGFVKRILSPNMLEIELSEGVIKFELLGPDFSQLDSNCSSSLLVQEYCAYIEEIVGNRLVGIALEDASGDLLKGDLTFDGTSLALLLIKGGYLRVNTRYHLNHALLIAEEEARCLYKGIWANRRGELEYEKSCMGR